MGIRKLDEFKSARMFILQVFRVIDNKSEENETSGDRRQTPKELMQILSKVQQQGSDARCCLDGSMNGCFFAIIDVSMGSGWLRLRESETELATQSSSAPLRAAAALGSPSGRLFYLSLSLPFPRTGQAPLLRLQQPPRSSPESYTSRACSTRRFEFCHWN